MKKENKGISLIVLVITIIVTIILATAVIVSIVKNNPIEEANTARYEADRDNMQTILTTTVSNIITETQCSVKINEGKINEVTSGAKETVGEINYSLEDIYENTKVEGKIIFDKGIDRGTTYYTGKKLPIYSSGETKWIVDKDGILMLSVSDKIFTGDNKLSLSQNFPDTKAGMIPVKYNGSKWQICKTTDKEWYDYENKKWANVMLSDGKYKEIKDGQIVEDEELGSMFVWIPRYAYSINEYKVNKNGEGTTQNITDVTFLNGTSNVGYDGVTYPRDYDIDKVKVGESTPKIVHPAFTFGNKELDGIWVAKFEASMAEENNNTYQNNNVTNKTIKVLPNKNSWRYIQIGNMFDTCLNMKNNNIYGLNKNTDSHMMKNSEWGAVAYLAVSKYGITPTINNNSEQIPGGYNSFTAGSKELGSYRKNVGQSTTENVTGIYDLNGGAWEYVAAYCDNNNLYLTTYGTSKYFENNKLKPEYEKYYDKYEVSDFEKNPGNLWSQGPEGNKKRKEITDIKYNLMKTRKGDAMYEVIDTYSYYGKMNNNQYNWGIDELFDNRKDGKSVYNNDAIVIGNIYLPFRIRGGGWWNGSYGGLFYSYDFHGGSDHCERFSTSFG